ncbi:hypothetical protein LA080_002415 [Diaporthe eres]|nr:hypothetical protein LA080_002415 [Diaporthe eres]
MQATSQSMDCSFADSVRRRSLQNPCLGALIEHMKHAPNANSTIQLLEYAADGQVPPRLDQFDQRGLPLLFESPHQATGRVLLIENLRPDVINYLGEHLDVDPLFFADYVNTDFQGIDKAPPPPSLAFCPSQIVERGHVHIHYQQVIDLGHPAIILTDPPVREVFQGFKRGENKIYQAATLHGGFEDFQQMKTEDWDKRSMLSSLLHYFRNHPPGFRTSNPSTLCFAYYPLRIALAEWVLYSHLVSRYHKHYEYSLQDVHKRPLESDIVDLQRWRRRITQSRQKLSLLSQFITYWRKDEVNKQPWDMLLLDIDSIMSKLQHYGHSMEQVVPVATGMVQLLDARESARQAANVTTLTYIATVFVPMSWVAGLFIALLVSFIPLWHMLMAAGRYLKGMYQFSRRRVMKKNVEDGCQIP